MKRPVIFIPEPFPAGALDAVPPAFEVVQGDAARACSEDELIEALKGVSALAVTSREQVTARVIDRAPDLRVIGKSGARPANVDMDAARRRGIEVVWSPTANVQSVAEMTLALILQLVKRLPELTGLLRAGRWRNYDMLGREFSGMTVGLVGLGNVGLAVARLLGATGARVIGFDPHVSAGEAARHGVEHCGLGQVFARSDLISLHCELNDGTRGIVGPGAFAAMKRGVYLVNTARGPLVDTGALLDALASGKVAAAALDVFPEEPVPPGHPLATHPRIVATPHMAAFTGEAIHRETREVLEDIVNVLSGRPPRHMG